MEGPVTIDIETLKRLYQVMVRVRRFDEKTVELFNAGLVKGTAHSYVGQEAVADGRLRPPRPRGRLHRQQPPRPRPLHRQGRPARPHDGRADGARGRATAAAWAAPCTSPRSTSTSSAPTASSPRACRIGAGAALAAKLRGTDRVVLSFFGDGGANQGVVHETMNLAAVWKLPFIFVCENNKYALSTDQSRTTAGEGVTARARAYGIPGVRVDGNDVLAVYEARGEAVARARRGEGPSCVEAVTYRWGGHSMRANLPDYRTKEEELEWMERDPIVPLRAARCSRRKASDVERSRSSADASRASWTSRRRLGDGEPRADGGDDGGRRLRAPRARGASLPAARPRDRPCRGPQRGPPAGDGAGRARVRHGRGRRADRRHLPGDHGASASGSARIACATRRSRSRPSWAWGWARRWPGMRPVVEIQIWDFIAMTMDQVVNQAAKFRYMLGGTPDGAAGDPRAPGRRHPPGRAALAEPRGLVRPRARARRRRALDALRRQGTARRGDPRRQPGHLPRAQDALPDQGRGARGATTLIPLGKADVKRAGHRRHGGRDPDDGAAGARARRRIWRRTGSASRSSTRGRWCRSTRTTILESVGKTHRLVIAHEAVKRGGFGAEVAAMVTEQALRRAGRADCARRRPQRAHAVQRQAGARHDPVAG